MTTFHPRFHRFVMPTTPSLRVHTRWIVRCDMPEVMAIERDSFAAPWSEGELLAVLKRRNTIGMVAEARDRIVGYMVYELHPDDLWVLNLAVAPDMRRRDVGRQMVAKLVDKLSAHRRRALHLRVRESNLPAQLFLRAVGFHAETVERDWYDDPAEDAYRMVYRLPGPGPF